MKRLIKAPSAALIAALLALGGCAYDEGYGSMSVGYGSPGYYDDYGYGYAPYGWYGGYYYPGNGYWLYDRGGRRHRWDDRQQRYWEQRRGQAGNNWHGPATRPWQPGERDQSRQWRGRQRGDGTPRAAGQSWRRSEGAATPAPQVQQQQQVQQPQQTQPQRQWDPGQRVRSELGQPMQRGRGGNRRRGD